MELEYSFLCNFYRVLLPIGHNQKYNNLFIIRAHTTTGGEVPMEISGLFAGGALYEGAGAFHFRLPLLFTSIHPSIAATAFVILSASLF